MPQAAKRPCKRSGCPNLVDRGYCVDCASRSPRALTEARRPSACKRGYTRAWSEYSRNRLKQFPLCVGYPPGQHADGCRLIAEVTDHIIAASKRPDLFWDPTNHQSLSQDCNKRKAIAEEGGFGR